MSSENARLQQKIRDARHLFDGKMAECTEARLLHSFFIEERYEKILPALFEDFKKQHPASSYITFLAPYNKQVLSFYETAKKEFSDNQLVVADYSQIKSFASLKEKFKGKMFFIDIWATWCGPCKAEFAYTNSLTSFLNQKGVAMLYISIDENKNDDKWKNMIKYYNLSGYHVRTNESLRKDLMTIFWDGNSYAIPRYVLVNEQGQIVEKNALKPSAKERLYKQISTHIQ